MQLRLMSLPALFLALWLAAGSAWALSLEEAKANGWVGETPTGYLASTNSSASPAVTALVNDINSQRRTAYQQAAQKAGTTLDIIEARIGQRLYQQADKGAYLLGKDGQWYRK